MNTRAAAKRLKVSPRTVRRMAGDGRLIPLFQVDTGITGAYIFAAAEIERYAATQGKALNGQSKAAS
jgi:predicted site-specific integrase-resolvase